MKLWRLIMVIIVSGLRCGEASSGQASASPDEKLLRGIEDGLEKINAQLSRLMNIVIPPPIKEINTTMYPIATSRSPVTEGVLHPTALTTVNQPTTATEKVSEKTTAMPLVANGTITTTTEPTTAESTSDAGVANSTKKSDVTENSDATEITDTTESSHTKENSSSTEIADAPKNSTSSHAKENSDLSEISASTESFNLKDTSDSTEKSDITETYATESSDVKENLNATENSDVKENLNVTENSNKTGLFPSFVTTTPPTFTDSSTSNHTDSSSVPPLSNSSDFSTPLDNSPESSTEFYSSNDSVFPTHSSLDTYTDSAVDYYSSDPEDSTYIDEYNDSSTDYTSSHSIEFSPHIHIDTSDPTKSYINYSTASSSKLDTVTESPVNEPLKFSESSSEEYVTSPITDAAVDESEPSYVGESTVGNSDESVPSMKNREKRSVETNDDVEGENVRTRQNRSLPEVTETNTSKEAPPNDLCILGDLHDDLCVRLLEVMDSVENITRQVTDGSVTEDVLEEVESSASELKDLVDQVEKEPTFVEELDKDILTFEVKELKRLLNKAEKVLEEKLVKLNKVNPLLVIILAAVGGSILVALVVMSVYTIRKKRRLRMKDEMGKISATNIPVQSFKEATGHDNPSFTQELLRPPTLEDGIVTSIPRPRSSIESFSHREPRPSLDTRPSSDPRGEGPQGSMNRTPSPYYSVPRPLGETHYYRNGSRPSSRVDEDELNDPYSLEGRGHNVRRIHSGSLMRIDT